MRYSMNVADPDQYRLGLTGVALLRNWLTGDSNINTTILKDIAKILDNTEPASVETPNLVRYGISDGYTKWATNYDNMPNLLIDAEEPAVKKILVKLRKGKVIDIACGTGRYAFMLNKMGHTVIGVDQSSHMLHEAALKCPNVTFLQSDIRHIPLSRYSFDHAISALALTHFENLDEVVCEIGSLVKKGGTIVLSDIHPMIVALGSHADFRGKLGERGFMVNYVHWHSDYVRVFKANELEIIGCLEPKLNSDHTKIIQQAFTLTTTTVNTALKGLPIALIWVLKKR